MSAKASNYSAGPRSINHPPTTSQFPTYSKSITRAAADSTPGHRLRRRRQVPATVSAYVSSRRLLRRHRQLRHLRPPRRLSLLSLCLPSPSASTIAAPVIAAPQRPLAVSASVSEF